VKIADHVQLADGRLGEIVEFPGPKHAVVEVFPGGSQMLVHLDDLRTLTTAASAND